MNWREFFKLAEPIVEDVLENIPEPAISEGMVRRDNFFHRCWLRLKLERPDLCMVQQRIELVMANYDPDAKLEDKEEEPDKENERKTL